MVHSGGGDFPSRYDDDDEFRFEIPFMAIPWGHH
jgi:hypothetical protein